MAHVPNLKPIPNEYSPGGALPLSPATTVILDDAVNRSETLCRYIPLYACLAPDESADEMCCKRLTKRNVLRDRWFVPHADFYFRVPVR